MNLKILAEAQVVSSLAASNCEDGGKSEREMGTQRLVIPGIR